MGRVRREVEESRVCLTAAVLTYLSQSNDPVRWRKKNGVVRAASMTGGNWGGRWRWAGGGLVGLAVAMGQNSLGSPFDLGNVGKCRVKFWEEGDLVEKREEIGEGGVGGKLVRWGEMPMEISDFQRDICLRCLEVFFD